MTASTHTPAQTDERTLETAASSDSYGDVDGRRSFDDAAGDSAANGGFIGMFIGLFIGLLDRTDPLTTSILFGLYGVVLGAALGSIVGLVLHARASGRSEPSAKSADRDDVPAEARSARAEVAERPARTALGAVHLTVSDLDRSLEYYTRSVGLQVLRRDGGVASLGTGGTELLVLVEEPGARSAAGYTGLFHFALLVPQREDLAAWLAHAARDRVGLAGLADHFVSEALYLTDPDGHGIEIYWDRPREVWEGQVAERMTTLPLDTDSLLGELDNPRSASFDGLPAGTTMGHVHLKVADIPATVAFYRDLLGFDLMAQLGRQAAFLAADGYHHHIGANTWESAGASPPPPGTAALRHATVALRDRGELDAVIDRLERHGHGVSQSAAGPLVRDPSGNALLLVTGPPATRDS